MLPLNAVHPFQCQDMERPFNAADMLTLFCHCEINDRD